jgi:hypothetical protein
VRMRDFGIRVLGFLVCVHVHTLADTKANYKVKLRI